MDEVTTQSPAAAPPRVRREDRRAPEAPVVEPSSTSFDPSKPPSFSNPRPTGYGDPNGSYVQTHYDPDDPSRQPPPEIVAANEAQAQKDDAGLAEAQERTRQRLQRVAESRQGE